MPYGAPLFHELQRSDQTSLKGLAFFLLFTDKAKVTSGTKELKTKDIRKCWETPSAAFQVSPVCYLGMLYVAGTSGGMWAGRGTQSFALVNVQPHEHMPWVHRCPALLQSSIWPFSGSVDSLEHEATEPSKGCKQAKIQVLLEEISCEPLEHKGSSSSGSWGFYLFFCWWFFFFFNYAVPSIAEGQHQTLKACFMQLSLRRYLNRGWYLLTGFQYIFNKSGWHEIRRLSWL